MAILGTVTDLFTEGFVEVALWENGQPGRTRCVAETSERQKRGNVVELESAAAWNERLSRYLYISVPVCFAIGAIFNHTGTMNDRLLSGLILAFMAFLISWILNRKSRLRRRLEYRVVRTVQKVHDPLDYHDNTPL